MNQLSLTSLGFLIFVSRRGVSAQKTPDGRVLLHKLESVHFPQISALDPSVPHQLAASQSALDSLLKDNLPNEHDLVEVYGSLDELYYAYGLEAVGACRQNVELLAPRYFSLAILPWRVLSNGSKA